MSAGVLTGVLLAVLVVALLLMSLRGNRGEVPWAHKLRRVNPGSVQRAEWMAPDDVVAGVLRDYIAATRWMHDSALLAWPVQLDLAPRFLAEAYLERYQTVLRGYRAARRLHFVGVLRADHQPTVRHFSEDGRHCLVLDHQQHRRMATYRVATHERVATQDLGDATVVYRMAYDPTEGRWKVAALIQELPLGWRPGASRRIQTHASLPPTHGRDT